MYYDKAGKLAMTHYCVLGNRPEMALKSADAKSITFDLDAACCTFDTKKESHMKGTVIRFATFMIGATHNKCVGPVAARLQPNVVIGVRHVPVERIRQGATRDFERHRVGPVGRHLAVDLDPIAGR